MPGGDRSARKKKKKKSKTDKKRRRADASSAKKKKKTRPKKRARTVDLTDDATQLLPFEVSDIPGPSALLDQVVGCTAGCAVLGTRFEVVYEPTRAYLDAEYEADTVRLRDEIEEAHADDQRRREAGECVARRSRYFDDVMRPDSRELVHRRVSQLWEGEQRVVHDDDDELEANGHTCFITHQVINYVEVIFRGRGRFEEREQGTQAYPCELVVRLVGGDTECVLEVRHMFYEDLVHNIQNGTWARKECGSVLDTTWLSTIPFELGMRGAESVFNKKFDLAAPADCTTILSEDMLLLRQALRIYEHADVRKKTKDPLVQTRVSATEKFQRALCPPEHMVDALRADYHYRWLQVTPFGKTAWNADGAKHVEEFYDA
jgi:hypothetical protein